MRVYECDHNLPPLPVPELHDTCENLKALTKPLIEKKEWETLGTELESFLQKDGLQLQSCLKQWQDDQKGNASWLRPIWDDSYLSYRDRLPINMNYTFELIKERWGDLALPKLLHGLCRTLDQLRTENLPTEKIRDTPISMDTLSYMIYTRIPTAKRDVLHHLVLAAPYTAAVVCRGYWYLLALTDDQGEALAPEVIQKALDNIRQTAPQAPNPASPGILTCAPRDEAASLRGTLQENLRNRIYLQQLEDAVCVICLDEERNAEGFMQELVLGTPENRWFDKSLQFICNGSDLGVSIEHSGCDAGIWIYLLTLVDDYACNQISEDLDSSQNAYVNRLNFYISDKLAEQLQQTAQDYLSAASVITVSEKKLANISRAKIKSVNCRPDALVQALYQAAYYKLTGRFRSTYEAVSTRAFYQGRTECVRPCTEAAADFARTFVDKSADSETILEKFHNAEKAHMDQIKRCQSGLGAERHMTGLMAMHQMFRPEESGLPSVFETTGYKTLTYSALSTSSTTAPYIQYFGFGPVVTDGIGVGYGLKSDALHLSISAYRDSTIDPAEFIDTIEKLADEFFALF